MCVALATTVAAQYRSHYYYDRISLLIVYMRAFDDVWVERGHSDICNLKLNHFPVGFPMESIILFDNDKMKRSENPVGSIDRLLDGEKQPNGIFSFAKIVCSHFFSWFQGEFHSAFALHAPVFGRFWKVACILSFVQLIHKMRVINLCHGIRMKNDFRFYIATAHECVTTFRWIHWINEPPLKLKRL